MVFSYAESISRVTNSSIIQKGPKTKLATNLDNEIVLNSLSSNMQFWILP